jgi:hypothetical protein
MSVSPTLLTARSTLQAKRIITANKLFARETANQALTAALRNFPADSQQVSDARGTLLGAQGDLNTARSDEATARTNLLNEIRTWLSGTGTPPPALTPDADFLRMTKKGAPVVLFPVRLETRFGVDTSTPPKPVLRVRIYPDEFLSDMHERELLPRELQASEEYWDQLPTDESGSPIEDVTRWTKIAKEFGVPRAAYIVRATFPDSVLPPMRATAPSRAAEAVLPDRFVVLAFKGGELRHMIPGKPIPEPLTFTPDPSDDAQTSMDVGDGFMVPMSVAWTVHYGEAESKGMAITIDNLAADEVTGGFDRVMVLGVKTSMEPEAAVSFIADLINAHHFTRGIDLVPQGTPTNNVPGRPTPFTMAEPSGSESFNIERVGPNDAEPGFTPDFWRLGDLFGFDPQFNVFRNMRESYFMRKDIDDGQNMRRALWGATLGYFMSQMMNPEPFLFGDSPTALFPPGDVVNARKFFTNFVSAQGPVPAFRVGAVPYGVLPAISVSRMVPATGENGTAITVMARLLSYWKNAAAKVKTVPRRSSHLNLDLMNVLTQKSHSAGVYVRNTIGVQTVMNLYQLLLQNFAELLNALTKPEPSILGPIGHPEWGAARIFSLNFLPTAPEYAGPLVTINPLNGQLVTGIPENEQVNPKTDPLNYLALLASADLPEGTVENQAGMRNAAPALTLLPLLYLLARHSYLTEMVEIGRRLVPGAFTQHKALDVEHWFILPTQPSTPVFPILKGTPTGFPRSLFESIKLNKDATANGVLDPATPATPVPQFPELRAALGNLSVLPVADLERLMLETLDLAAHRLDAFVTGLATRRLLNFRASERGTGPIPVHPAANYYGAYGFVEDVRPTARTTRQIPNLGTVDVQANNGGFIHAPSLRHATTAAILRSGRMSEKSDPTKYALELSSARARSAREMMDGLRDGQTQGAILGARLERGLRAAGQAVQINQMEAYILALRLLFPQVANKSGNDAGLPANRIAARNVVDGKQVRDWMGSHPDLPFGSGGLPAGNSTAAGLIRAEVKKLDDLMDALGDLVMAESVYQIAAGDAITAEAATSFLPAGNTPPEPQVTDSPTTGVAVNHRVALVMEPMAPQQGNNWTTTTPRGSVDPYVEDWAERQLGDPATVTATIRYQVSGTPGEPQPPPATTTFSMADLQIGALDFLALAQSTAVAGQRSPLDRMIDRLFREGLPEATILDVTYDTPGASGRSIAQLFELARALGGVLGSARELTVADLRRAEDGVDDDALADTAGPLLDQAQAAIGALATVRDELVGGDIVQALRDASAYLADAFPDANASEIELDAAAVGAQSELARRVSDAQKELDAANASATNAAKIAGAVQALRILFGRNTLAVMPAFAVQGADEIRKSLAALDRPIDLANPATFDAHQAPWRFLQQASRVHERLGSWRRFQMYAGAFGAAAPRASVAQLPFVATEDWAGRSPPLTSRTSLVLVSASGQTAAPNTAQPWRGLLLDQWTEIVPSDKAETALAFHYDSQNSEAPQVILFAVHSGQGGGVWTLAELYTIVNETMDLAQSRPVDNDMLALGQLDPPIVLASNPENNIVSTTIGPESRQGPPLIG